MSFPLADWQFWTVSVAAIWGFWIVARQFLPSRGDKACPGCPSGAAARKRRPDGDLVTLGDRG